MSQSNLLIKLRDLHEDLSVINDNLGADEKVDDETIDALGQLVTDIGTLVDHGKETEVAEKHSDMLDRILKFQTQHPRVSGFLTEVTDMLSMLGI